ncbi:protein FAM180B [Ornithorhynchus anatinus]|uniref:protein FAM180B n=1 Tax=Ornithorhynchus anatinus TaxID=9258 RepID=UPI0010A7A478|nr:protein FAM180B [Ornithorhynchus anatinus]
MAVGLHLRAWAWAALGLCLVAGSRGHRGESTANAGSSHSPQEPEDVDVMFELLWGGLELDGDGQLRPQDEELASMRSGRRLAHLLHHRASSGLAGVERRVQQLEREAAPLDPVGFEQLVLTSLFCAYRLQAAQGEERGQWIQLFFRLVQETLRDLCKGFCPQGHPSPLALWAVLNPPPQ